MRRCYVFCVRGDSREGFEGRCGFFGYVREVFGREINLYGINLECYRMLWIIMVRRL